MKDRIQQLIDIKGISGGELADKLGVQRSNVSHVLNGRNKPGAVFLEKLLQAFPELNARWLLTGEGNILNTSDSTSNAKTATVQEKDRQQKLFPPVNTPSTITPLEEDKEIERIILLYTDGTFTYYNDK